MAVNNLYPDGDIYSYSVDRDDSLNLFRHVLQVEVKTTQNHCCHRLPLYADLVFGKVMFV